MADTDLADAIEAFEAFVSRVEPVLHRSLAGWCGPDVAADATAEALAWAWEHWVQVTRLEHPVGYLYRVGQSRSRARKPGLLPAPHELGMPHIEPGLIPALQALPPRQRTAVWLVHGCGWSQVECRRIMAAVEVGEVDIRVERACVDDVGDEVQCREGAERKTQLSGWLATFGQCQRSTTCSGGTRTLTSPSS